MAEIIRIPVAKQILGKAADLALEQIGLLWNFRRELKKLPWKIFDSTKVAEALPGEVPEDPQVYEVGKQILRKCNGVPLAVSTMATMLSGSKDPKTELPSFLSKSLSTFKYH
ncbi:unnamed protein product [Linum tenue]|uniref:NB-ARC domain-containing protein n=1 Tax=Linum tenue TaxID=586396 RepID=A0AAV0RBI3_9ROSI|nr:unnamed protein product [Linum tenue]